MVSIIVLKINFKAVIVLKNIVEHLKKPVDSQREADNPHPRHEIES